MLERIIGALLLESNWLFASLVVAGGLTLVALRRLRADPGLDRSATASLLYGLVIGMMGLGHLTAVLLEQMLATLDGFWPLLYLIGLVIALPALALAKAAYRALRRGKAGKRLWLLNLAVGLILLALGPTNAPLAAPAALNIVLYFQRRRTIQLMSTVGLAAIYLALLAGSFVFFWSGQSFESFTGLE